MKHRVWKLAAAVVMTLAISVGELAGIASAAPKDEKWANRAAAIAKRTRTEEVKTIQWRAKLTENLKGTVVGNKLNPADPKIGTKVKIKKNKKVTIIQRDYHEKKGVSQCMLADGQIVYIPNKYLKITKPLATGKYGDYSAATKEAYINGQNIDSGDQYLIWVSLDKQRVNVFKGSNHNWKLLYEWKCSTGKADAPTLDQSFKSKYVIQWKKEDVRVDGSILVWYSAVYGSGIHKFPGSGANKALGVKPISHSCIRLPEQFAKWIWDNTKAVKSTKDADGVGAAQATRVWIW